MSRLLQVFALFHISIWSVGNAQPTDGPETEPWMQWGEQNPTWVTPFEPFRIIGNIYFVGTEGLSSFLIASPDGHILIDGGLPQNASQVLGSVAKLGFDIKDVKTLLNSHAHFDHSGSLNAIKQASGAKLLASEGDRSALEGGFYLGYEDNINYSAPPVSVDALIKEGDTIAVGKNKLVAHITPGHTRGCTSFSMTVTEGGKDYDVLFFCGATVAGNTLVPEQYEGIVNDYRLTFSMTADWQPDVLLVNHPFFFDMKAKRQRQIAGQPLAFVDGQEFQKFIAHWKAAFEERLEAAQSSNRRAK